MVIFFGILQIIWNASITENVKGYFLSVFLRLLGAENKHNVSAHCYSNGGRGGGGSHSILVTSLMSETHVVIFISAATPRKKSRTSCKASWTTRCFSAAAAARTVPCRETEFRKTRTENRQSQLFVWIDGYLGCTRPGKTAGVPSSPLFVTGFLFCFLLKKKKKNGQQNIQESKRPGTRREPARSGQAGSCWSAWFFFASLPHVGRETDDVTRGSERGFRCISCQKEMECNLPLPF